MRDLDECNPYVLHLHAQHRRLQESVRSILATLQMLKTTRDVSEPGFQLNERLSTLHDDLTRHFSEEEEGGCIEEAISRCPSLSHVANALEGQHSILLNSLEQIIERTREETLAAGLSKNVEREFDEFAEQLRAHENLENRILQQAFGSSFEFESSE